jgi:hypothetical protein
MKILELPDSWRARAIVIREAELSPAWFSAAELDEANAFRLAKRREEWMHARIAAKQLAIERGLATDPRTIAITRPRFSLSHSHPYVFLRDEEAEAMRTCSVPHRILHFWAAKEAAWKQRSHELATLKQLAFALQSENESGLVFDSVETIAIGDAVIALTRPTS